MHPRRVRHDVPAAPEAGLIVSIHAPAWGATTRGMFPIVSFGFQSTHPRGVRRIRPSDARLQLPVSIHAPAWGATRRPWRLRCGLPCFNPRTRVGCDGLLGNVGGQVAVVSIHAPAWGATWWPWRRHHHRKRVSIHAPAWGATRAVVEAGHGQKVSIHAPAWGATKDFKASCAFLDVSIHAPAWGATKTGTFSHCALTGFNPRTRVGCDWSTSLNWIVWRVSIHAPAWGATARRLGGQAALSKFQSTHPRGVRPNRRLMEPQPEQVSIHAPAWGATGDQFQRDVSQPVSIHAPAWGATHGQACRGAWLYGFNPRTRVGCDFELPLNVGIIGKFQSTHPRGVRHAAGRQADLPR